MNHGAFSKTQRVLSLGWVALLFLGCASKGWFGGNSTAADSRAACANLDWFEVGRFEGSQGLLQRTTPATRVCAEFAGPEQNATYTAGWNLGIVEFCTPERAFNWGRLGKAPISICPDQLGRMFSKRYEAGRKVFELEKRNASLEARIDELVRRSSQENSVDLNSETERMKQAKKQNDALIDSIEKAPTRF